MEFNNLIWPGAFCGSGDRVDILTIKHTPINIIQRITCNKGTNYLEKQLAVLDYYTELHFWGVGLSSLCSLPHSP